MVHVMSGVSGVAHMDDIVVNHFRDFWNHRFETNFG